MEKKLKFSPSDAFFTDNLRLINEKSEEIIIKKGPEQSGSTSSILLSDNWSINNSKPQGKENVNEVSLNNLWEIPQGYEYDKNKGTLVFKDDSIKKIDQYGCVLTEGEISLNELGKDIEMMSYLDRLNFLGSIYDFQFRQINFGRYKYSNAYTCRFIANTYGYFSIDKLINDEYARKQWQNEQNERFAQTVDSDKYPPYSGFLDSEEFKNDGWISIDQLIYNAKNDENGYDPEWSMAIRTRPIKDRKKILINT
jgi:hypothetical protein